MADVNLPFLETFSHWPQGSLKAASQAISFAFFLLFYLSISHITHHTATEFVSSLFLDFILQASDI